MTSTLPTTLSPLLKFRLLASVLPFLLLGAAAFMINLASANINTYHQNLTDINLKQQTFDEAQSLNQFVSANLTTLEQMSVALPSESMMVSVVQDFEAVIKTYDPEATVKFGGQTPVRVGQDLIIPVTIVIKTSSSQIAEVLTQLTQLPYIIQLLTLDTQFYPDSTTSVINLRLYVQDPYTGY